MTYDKLLGTKNFSHIQKFLIFIGQPRSGHSVLGALLNAHPNISIGHNLDILDLLDREHSRESIFESILE